MDKMHIILLNQLSTVVSICITIIGWEVLGLWFAIPFLMLSLWGAYLTSCVGHDYIQKLVALSSDTEYEEGLDV
tara:strand:+ start:186 stop:407 length:222 start_codon:yes stop_codon:yes gene_type:complete